MTARPRLSEADLEKIIYPRLEKSFRIETQVTGKGILFGDQEIRVRIDALLFPKKPEKWRLGSDTVLGIECKRIGMKVKDVTEAVRQIRDYTICDFNGHRHFPIFLCPEPTEMMRNHFCKKVSCNDECTCLGEYMAREWGKDLIGEVRNIRRYDKDKDKMVSNLSLVMNGEVLWSELDGERSLASRMNLKRKWGSDTKSRFL